MGNHHRIETAESVLQKLAELRAELAEQYTVTRIGLFGSFIQGNENIESDLDILVDFSEPTFDHYMDLKFRLEAIFNRKVDLVMTDTIKPRIKPHIEKQVIYA